MENNFINVDYDKFTNKKTTLMGWFSLDTGGDRPGYGYHEYMKIRLRHISIPNQDSLMLDLEYMDYDWIFLRSGKLIININNVENIVLEPHESFSETVDIGYATRCRECVWYDINQEILTKICNAKTIDFQISGGKFVVEVNANQFIKDAQLFYNGFYDSTAFISTLQEETERAKKTANNSGDGCMVTLIVMVSAFSSIAASIALIIGII